jgi:DNA polymerase-3 subunit beta
MLVATKSLNNVLAQLNKLKSSSKIAILNYTEFSGNCGDRFLTVRATDLDNELVGKLNLAQRLTEDVKFLLHTSDALNLVKRIVKKFDMAEIIPSKAGEDGKYEAKVTLKFPKAEFDILANYDLDTFPYTKWSDKEAKDNFTIQSGRQIFKDIERILKYSADGKVIRRENLEGAYFSHKFESKEIDMVATSGHRLFKHTFKNMTGTNNLSTIISNGCLTIIKDLSKDEKNDSLEFSKADRMIQFTIGDWKVNTSTIEGSFPDYTQVIPRAGVGKTSSFLNIDMMEAVELVSPQVDKTKQVTVKMNGKLIELGCKSARVNVDSKAETEPLMDLKFAINISYLDDALKSFEKDDRVLLCAQDTLSPVVVTCESDPNVLAVIMPMRI